MTRQLTLPISLEPSNIFLYPPPLWSQISLKADIASALVDIALQMTPKLEQGRGRGLSRWVVFFILANVRFLGIHQLHAVNKSWTSQLVFPTCLFEVLEISYSFCFFFGAKLGEVPQSCKKDAFARCNQISAILRQDVGTVSGLARTTFGIFCPWQLYMTFLGNGQKLWVQDVGGVKIYEQFTCVLIHSYHSWLLLQV